MPRSEGIRIRHETIRPPEGSKKHTVIVVDMTEPKFGAIGPCGWCGIDHGGFKVRHIEIDQEGFAIVSAAVWEGLQHTKNNAGFTIANTVSQPPTLIHSLGADGTISRRVKGEDLVPEILTSSITTG